MNLKKYLQLLQPSLNLSLPKGGIEKLAERCETTRHTARMILTGTANSDSYKYSWVVKEALNIIEEDATSKLDLAKNFNKNWKAAAKEQRAVEAA